MTRAAAPLTLLVLLMLAACARPLSPTETMVAKSLFGDALDTSRVSVTAGIGALPLPQPRRAAAPAMV